MHSQPGSGPTYLLNLLRRCRGVGGPTAGRRLVRLVAITALAVSMVVTAQPTPTTAQTPTPELPTAASGDSDNGHLIVTPADGAGIPEEIADAVAALGGSARELPHSGLMAVTVPDIAAGAARTALEANPLVDAVEIDAAVEATRTPNDPQYSDQWALPHIEAPGAWNATVGAASVSIAVLDTGVDSGHGDLSARIGRSYDAVGNGNAKNDSYGHGTKAAGVAAASTDNSSGVAGVCWQCEIWPVKVLADDGSGRHSDVAEGVRWAADQGADIISLSLGGHGKTSTLESAAREAVEAGSLVIASAGNYGTSDPVYPAAYDDVVGVGAVDQGDTRTSYSSYGSWVTVAAPGCTITTIAGGGYNQFCGTSSSAPQVAGLAGLAVAADGSASPTAVRAAIADGAKPIGQGMGSGRINADATLQRVETRSGNDDGGNDDGGNDDGGNDDGGNDDGGDGDDGNGEPVLDSLERIVGSNRFATAAALSAQNVDPGGERVFVATGQHFADALAAGAAAGSQSAPVLLVARSQLPAPTADELARLQPDEVVVVGGDGVIADRVVTAVGTAANAPVRRVAGANRFATAAEIATSSFSGPLGVTYLATGEGFADALAGVPAAVVENAPMLLTGRDDLPTSTRDALRELSPRRVVILGGENAVSARVRRQLLTAAPIATVQRLSGSDRFATAAAVADAVFDAGSVEEVAVATGEAFPDALAAGPIAGASASPLLLVGRDQLPDATRGALRRADPSHAWLLGGPNAISEAVAGTLHTTTH